MRSKIGSKLVLNFGKIICAAKYKLDLFVKKTK